MGSHSLHRATRRQDGSTELIEPRQLARFSKTMSRIERKAEQKRLVVQARALINRTNLSYSAVATRVGLSQTTVSAVMADSPTCLPSIATLEKIIKELGGS